MGRMSRFLRFCAFLSVLFFTTNVFAAGYSCPTYKKYTSCNAGYWLNGTEPGNSCDSCPTNWTSNADATAQSQCYRKIVLNKNGGSGTLSGTDVTDTSGGTANATIKCYYGTSCSFPTASGLTQSGYRRYAGWSTSSANSSSTSRSFSITSTATTVTYYAARRPIYTITLDNQSATSAGTSAVYEVYGAGVYLTSTSTSAMSTTANPITLPTRTGYTFGGYYTSANGGGTQMISATGYKTSNFTNTYFSAAGTLYAKWTANCNTITLNNTSHGGTGGTTVIYKKTGATTYYSDSACSTTITTVTKPTKTNATYAGAYNTSATSGGTACISSDGTLSTSTTCNVTGATTWYARYNCNENYRGAGTTITGTCTPSVYTITLKNYDNTATHSTIYQKYATGWYSDSGATTTLSAATVPTRSGYKFRGFYTSTQTDLTASGGSGTRRITAAGDLPGNTTFTANTSLYAAWAKDCTTPDNGTCSLTISSDGTATYAASCDDGYTVSGATTATPSCSANCNAITLDANGGTAGSVATLYKKTGSGTWYTNSTCTTAYSTTTDVVPTRSGYTFRGFYSSDLSDVTGDNSSGTQYITKAGASSTSGTNLTVTGATTVYAAWAKNCTTPNNGSCSLSVSDAGAVDYTTSCNTGYSISGNNTATPSCSANCNAITLDANGGTAGSVATLYKKTGSGTWYTNSTCTTAYSTTTNVVPTRSDYTFRGFYLSDPADISATQTGGTARHITHAGATTDTGNNWTITGAATLYAGWAQNCAPGTKATCTLTVGQNTTYTTGCNTGYNIKSGSGTYNPVCQANTYTVAYNSNKPSTASGTVSGTTANSSHTYDAAKALTTNGYSLTGWTFAGWNTKADGSGTSYSNGASVTNLTSTNGATVTLYAKWTANTITLKWANGGRGTAPTNPASCTYDGTFTMPAAMTATGYTFNKWSVNSKSFNAGATGVACTSANLGVSSGTATITGTWTANTYTVSFNVNGGSGGQTADVTATYDSAMPTISTTAPTKTACKFNGWYDATSGGTQYYTAAGASARTWNKTANTTLYAQWSCMTVSASAKTLTYNGTTTSNGTGQSCATTFTVSGPSSYTVTYSSSSSGTYSATAPTLTNAGTTTVYYKVAATDYTAYSGSYTCTMNTKAMTVSDDDKSKVYDGSALTCSVSVSVPSSGATIKYGTTSGTYNLSSAPTQTNVGSQTVYYQVTGNNFTTKTGSFKCSVTKATMNASLAGNSKTYDGSALTCNGGTQTGVPSGSTITYGTSTSSYSSTVPTVTNVADSKTIYYKITNSNYNDFTGSFQCTVNNATITASASNKTLTYNGTTTSNGTAQSCANVTVSSPSGTSITYSTSSNGTYSATAPTLTNAGTTTVYYKVAATDYTAYSGSYTCTMNTKAMTVSDDDKSKVYDGSALTCSVSVSVPSSGATIKYGTTSGTYNLSSAPTQTNVGSQTVYYQVTGNNFTTKTGSFKCSVTKATMNASLAGNSKTYDGSALTCNGGTQTGVPSGSTITYGTSTSSYSSTVPTVTNVADSKTIYYKITNSNYNDFTGSFQCTVNKADNPIVVNSCGGTIAYPNSDTFTVSSAQGTVTVTSGDTSIATVSYSGTTGTVKSVKPGDVTITVTAAGNANYKAGSKTCTYEVDKGTNPITLSANSGSINYNGTGTFTVSGAQGTLSVSSASSTIATASLNGTTVTMTGKQAGSTTITVTAAGNANYYAGSKTYTVTVNKIDGTTTVSKTSMTITYPTTTGTFTASCSESGAASVSSSDTSKATVSISSGTATVTWKAAGNATITVNCAATTNYNASSKTVAVTIAKGTNTLALNATSGTIAYPNTGTFTVKTNTSGGTLSVTSGTTSVATASISGSTVTMTSVKPGTSTITVTSAATNYYNAATATYALTVSKGTNPITLSANSGSINYNGTGTFTVSGAQGTLSVSSASTTVATASLSNTTVTMTGKQAGNTTITVTAAGNDYYNSGSKTYSLTVNKIDGTTTVSKTSMTITYPTTTGTFTASCSESGAASVSSSDTSKATVSISSGTATVTWKAAGNATITVNCAATTNYNASSKTVAVTIAKGTNTLALSATSGTLSYTSSNKTKSFTVSTNTSGGALSAVSSATGVATVAVSDTTVTATYVKAGSTTITVTSAETSYYNAATATYALTVNCGAGYYSNSSACTICGAGTYTSSANTASSCTNVNAGCYGGQGATSACPTECAIGSYSAAGASACTACTNGKTTSGTGKTSCDATCSNANGANAWATASWSANTVSNLCTISKCNANTYYTVTTGTGYANTCTSCGSNSSTAAGNTSTTCTCAAGYTSTGKVDGASTSTSGCSLISNIACAIGQYVPAKATSCSACTAGYYCPNSAKTYSYSTSIQGRTPCSAGTYQPDTGKTSCLSADKGYYVGSSAATEQKACTGATYADKTGQSACTVCPTATNNASKATGYAYWNAGGTADHTTVAGCYVYYSNDTIDNGSASEYYCYADTDAATTGEYGVDGTSKGCWVYWNKLKCDGGYYNKNYSTSSKYDFTNKTIANLKANACIAVGAGNWSANDALTRTACDSGLTTIGYGTGANEAADCGRKLHAGDNVIYLRSAERTSLSLRVKVGDKTFFGALSTALSGALKVKNGSTTYSVVNDWQ